MFTCKFTRTLTLGAMLMGWATTGWSQVTVLTFEGLQDNQEIGDYYNGGGGGDYGISFMPGALALIGQAGGGGGNFAGGSSGTTIAYFVEGGSAVMNVAAGFTTGFSFYYAAFEPGTVTVYSGSNATGTVLGSFDLPRTVFGESVLGWDPIGVEFTGLAYSVSFGGAENKIGFDDITLGSAVAGGSPIPEPSTYALVLGASALLGVGLWRRRTAS